MRTVASLSLFTKWILLSTLVHQSRSQTDTPCFLSTGTSRESFTASELLPVGSVIGSLNIYGDPSENGTVELKLSQSDSAVEIAPGTKKLVLRQKLDKEGVEGPSEVNLQIYCRKKNSTEMQSFPIPLRIFVNDANDNAPEFVDIPDYLEVSEMAQPGTVVTRHPIRAFDKDQMGPYSTVQYSMEPGPYSEHFTFMNPLKGVLSLKTPLDYESLPKFNITVRAQDLGNPPLATTQMITVSVLDADDLNPKFEDERYTAVLPDEPRVGDILDIKPRPIVARDMDVGLNTSVSYSFKSDQVDGKYFSINESTGEMTLVRSLPEDIVFPFTLVIKAVQTNNPERSAMTTLTLSQRSTFLTGLRFLQNDYILSVPEDLPINQSILLAQTNKLDDRRLRFSIENNDYFSVTDRGEIILNKPLDYGQVQHLSLQMNVSDGKLGDGARLHIDIIDVNRHSPEFGSKLYNFVVLDGVLLPGMTLGQVDAHDEDIQDTLTFSLAGDSGGIFHIDNTGVIQVMNVSQLNTSLTHLIVTATDNGHPPRRTSVPVIITVPDDIRLSSMHAFNSDSSCLLMIIFGAMLGLLIIIILVLALYIAKLKHPRPSRKQLASQPLSKVASFMTGDIPHQKLPKGSPSSDSRSSSGLENPVFVSDQEMSSPSTSSKGTKEMPLSNGKTISTATTLKASSKPNPKFEALMPFPRIDPTALKYANGVKHKDVCGSETSTTSLQSGSIPRRIKKLSWEDEKAEKSELDPAVSVSPLPENDARTSNASEQSVFF